MADPTTKHADNVPGKYYVDESCSACMVCCDTAPNNFKMSDDESHAYVMKQPATPEEKAQCEEAVDGCPETAIGNDA